MIRKSTILKSILFSCGGLLFLLLSFVTLQFCGVKMSSGSINWKPLKGDYWNPEGSNDISHIVIDPVPVQVNQVAKVLQDDISAQYFLDSNTVSIQRSLTLATLIPIAIGETSTPRFYFPAYETGSTGAAWEWLAVAAVCALKTSNYVSAESFFEAHWTLYQDQINRPFPLSQRLCLLNREKFFYIARDYLATGNSNASDRQILRIWAKRYLTEPGISTQEYILGALSQDFSSELHLQLLEKRFKKTYKDRKLPIPRFNPELARETASNLASIFGSVERKFKDWSQEEMEALEVEMHIGYGGGVLSTIPRLALRRALNSHMEPYLIIQSYFKVASIVIYLDYLDWVGAGKDAGDWRPDFSSFTFNFRYTYNWVRPGYPLPDWQVDDNSRGGFVLKLITKNSEEPWLYSYETFIPFPIGTDVVKFFGTGTGRR